MGSVLHGHRGASVFEPPPSAGGVKSPLRLMVAILILVALRTYRAPYVTSLRALNDRGGALPRAKIWLLLTK